MKGMLIVAFVGFALCASACGGRIVNKPAPGSVTSSVQIDDKNTLKIDVNQVSNNLSRKKIETIVHVSATGPDEVRFPRSAVSLNYNGASIYARDLRKWENDIDIRPGQSKEKWWAFHVEQEPAPGDYELKIAQIGLFKNGAVAPTDKTLQVKIHVPGKGQQ